jgi:hypothetical protein
MNLNSMSFSTHNQLEEDILPLYEQPADKRNRPISRYWQNSGSNPRSTGPAHCRAATTNPEPNWRQVVHLCIALPPFHRFQSPADPWDSPSTTPKLGTSQSSSRTSFRLSLPPGNNLGEFLTSHYPHRKKPHGESRPVAPRSQLWWGALMALPRSPTRHHHGRWATGSCLSFHRRLGLDGQIPIRYFKSPMSIARSTIEIRSNHTPSQNKIWALHQWLNGSSLMKTS